MRAAIPLLGFTLFAAPVFAQSTPAQDTPTPAPEELRARAAIARMREIERIVGSNYAVVASPGLDVLIARLSPGLPMAAWIATEADADKRSEELIANAPLCSGIQSMYDRSLRSVLSTARWELEHTVAPQSAAASAESLQQALEDYTQRLREVTAKVPEIQAARARLGFPMPEVCAGAEAESRANLAELQNYVAKLRERAAQPASSR